MSTSRLLQAWRWLFPPSPREPLPALCVPEWSEPMADYRAPIWWRVKSYTNSSVERVVVLCQSIAYLEKHRLPRRNRRMRRGQGRGA